MRLLPAKLTPRTRAALLLLACLLSAPAFATGFVLDDYQLVSRLRAPDGTPRWRGLLDAFSFVTPHTFAEHRELGWLPWWSAPDLTLDFFRPLAALSHLLDLWLFGLNPWPMHLVSVGILLALNLTVWRWYERLFGDAPRTLALAFSLYVLAPGHGFAASWLANRNALLAALFALLSLIWHDDARRGARPTAHLLSLGALLASLLSGELGVSTLALLVAHAACLDRAPWRQRARALLPALLLTLAWLALYRALGHGARGSSLYIDLLRDPLGYTRQLLTHVPILLSGQWLLPLLSLTLLLSRQALLTWAAFALLVLILLAPAVLAVVRRDPRARFCGLAALLSLLPIASTVPHDRLLIVADMGGFGLLALTLESAWSNAMRGARLLEVAVAARLIASIVLTPLYAAALLQHVEVSETPFADTLREPSLAQQTLVFVNPPCVYFAAHLLTLRAVAGGPAPHRLRNLAPGIYPLTIQRLDERTLSIRSEGGLLQPLGRYRSQLSRPPGPVAPVYAAQVLNQFTRDGRPFAAGSRVELSDLTVSLVELTSDGFPLEVHFQFRKPLEDQSLRFMRWSGRRLVPFALPTPGASLTLAPVLD